MKKPILQAPLFNLDSPPVKPPSAPEPTPAEHAHAPLPPEMVLFAQETTFYLALYEHLGKLPNEVFTCLYCGKEYRCLTFHLLRGCRGQWEPKEEIQVGNSQPEEVQRPEPSENMPGEYAYKKKGVPEGEKMHPSYRPPKKEEPQKETLKGPPALLEKQASEGPTLKVELVPHFWHWTRSTDKMKAQEAYTPPLTVRRRSIPAIACSLYYCVEAAVLSMKALSGSPPQYYAVNKIFYDVDKRKVERYIKLLVFCGLDEERVRWWVREAWTAAKEGPLHPWPDIKKGGEVIKKGAGPGLLGLLGYHLEEKEPDGFGDTNLASMAEFLQEEGVTGR